MFSHSGCKHYINNYHIGFRTVSPKKGEIYEGKHYAYHSLVFLLDGEIEFSYNEFLNRQFKKGDLFFIPQASNMFGTAMEDSRMLVLTFNNRVDTFCDNCTLSKNSRILHDIKYDFRPLPMDQFVWGFVETVEQYITQDIRCEFLHQLKQKELFVILQYSYTKEEIVRMFYPAIGNSTFRSWVLENYTPDTSMSDLAYRCNMIPKSFSRKFAVEFGVTFREWVLKQKVKHIGLRLSMPNTLLNDIIRDFRFSDQSHFYRFCKEHYGCNPTQFRAKLKAETTEM